MDKIKEKTKAKNISFLHSILISFVVYFMLVVVSIKGIVRAEVLIPQQSDWTDQGVVIIKGPSGSWDVRLNGMISPCTVVKKDGTYFLYYIPQSYNKFHSKSQRFFHSVKRREKTGVCGRRW